MTYSQLEKLVEKVKGGDSQAFADIYSATYQKTYYFALSLVKNEYGAQDAVQETYLKALSSISSLRDNKLLASWLNRITYNVCMDMLGVSKNVVADSEEVIATIEDANDDDDPLLRSIKNDTQRMLIRHIEKLSPRLRAVVVLKYYNDLKISEIAYALNINEGTVKSRLNMAKKRLKNSITATKEYGAAFALLPFTKAFSNSASGVGLSADTALNMLTSALNRCDMNTKIAFKPHPNSSIPMSRLVAPLSAVGGSVAVVSACVVFFAASPEFISTQVDDAGYKYETRFSVGLSKTPHIRTIYAVSPSGVSIEPTGEENGLYDFTADENGVFTVVAVATNGRVSECSINVTNVDNTVPAVRSYYEEDGVLSVQLVDDLAGIDFDSIYGELPNGETIRPASCDTASGTIVFEIKDMNFVFFVSDFAGNISRNTVSVR